MTGSARLEIIDGLQRLNSIFEFIENEYPVAGAYFDLERSRKRSCAATKASVRSVLLFST
jgi:hypothetical protein